MQTSGKSGAPAGCGQCIRITAKPLQRHVNVGCSAFKPGGISKGPRTTELQQKLLNSEKVMLPRHHHSPDFLESTYVFKLNRDLDTSSSSEISPYDYSEVWGIDWYSLSIPKTTGLQTRPAPQPRHHRNTHACHPCLRTSAQLSGLSTVPLR